MKHNLFFLLSLMLIVFLGACEQDPDLTSPQPTDEMPAIGQIHTEVLAEIYAGLDPVTDKSLSKAARNDVVIEAVNRVTDKYGVDRMSPEDILSYVENGRQMAQQDPVQLIASLLTPAEQEWWNRFSWEAEISDARQVYMQHVKLYGAPQEGGMLAQILDVGLSSAEFWHIKRADDVQTYHNPYVPTPRAKGWKKFIRFAVQVVVDGAAGGAAGVGAGTVTGPVGGAVVGGIVGGLASHGADDVLFG